MSERLKRRVSVGHLADFIHRGGDLGPRDAPRVAAIEGLRRQQRAQAGAGARYRAEVFFRHQWRNGLVELTVAGRADGVEERERSIRIEEMKTHRSEGRLVHEREGRAHDAQLRLYGGLWAHLNPEDTREIALEIIYLDADSDDAIRVAVEADREALLRFFDDTCQAYALWLTAEAQRLAMRDAYLAELAFPAPAFRPGQRALARQVWRALSAGGALFAEAPTGIGKTLGVLYAALRRLPGLDCERALYLTPRGSARQLAIDAVAKMDPEGRTLRVVELIARERMCPTPGTPCRRDACERARGHFDRRRAALSALLGHADDAGPITVARGQAVAARHKVCPAALQHDAARFADLIVCDYNYAFDPFARQRALLDPEDGGAALLVDEAHNLADRARVMYSAELVEARLQEAIREARRLDAPFLRILERFVQRAFASDGALDAALLDVLDAVLAELVRWLIEAPPGPPLQRFEEVRKGLSRFLEIGRIATGPKCDGYREHLGSDARGMRRLQCLDAAPLLEDVLAEAAALVCFSATLAPMPQRMRELGVDASAAALVLPNPFPPERRLLLLLEDVDLRARRRSQDMPRLLEAIEAIVASRPGHYLVFAPSFTFLDVLADALEARRSSWRFQRQRPAMTEAERCEFIAAMRQTQGGGTRVAFAVSGGLFAEGVDLPGDALIGVIVAGLPLPVPDVERKALADYHGDAGRDLAFRTPAVTRMLQAAGRLVRSEQDAGIVCIADARLCESGFRRLLPNDWSPLIAPAREAGCAAGAFWRRLDAGS
ncbi:MAG: ATP-dependent DNA helicase [Pseudomonadota bacterium]|nr:ATP-dependent DNA helicase [Pseudomonadota bacterium]